MRNVSSSMNSSIACPLVNYLYLDLIITGWRGILMGAFFPAEKRLKIFRDPLRHGGHRNTGAHPHSLASHSFYGSNAPEWSNLSWLERVLESCSVVGR